MIYSDYPKRHFTDVIAHKIITTDDTPINNKKYRFPPVHKEEINNQVSELLDTM